MKTNLVKITAAILVPDDWDHEKCAALRTDPTQFAGGQPPADVLAYDAGPIDKAIDEHLASLAAALQAIDPDIELAHSIAR